jgi:hypothetical protein
LASTGCVLWLEELQPAFATIAVGALAYQSWLVGRRPAARRTRAMLFILTASLSANAVVALTWAALWLRYQ